MIAKDESELIAQAIQSVRPIISEIILIDTGSADDTREIAESFGAKVHQLPWTGDFSEPRNLSLKLATGDWILVLDADEAIDASDHSKLVKLTRDRSKCYRLTQRHYSNDPRLSDFQPVRGEFPQWERHYGGYFESSLIRLFPNHEGIKYIGRVHELVEHSIQQLNKHSVVACGIRLHHYGHTPEIRAKKNKGKLYTPLGQAKIHDNPTDWQSYFELGVEHNNNGRLKESVEAFLKSIEMNSQYLPTWVNLGYVFCELRMFKEAIHALQSALKLDPKSFEACCNLGVVHLRVGDHKSAERFFSAAIALNPRYVNAMSNLAKALTFQNRFSEAVHFLKRVIELLPQSAVAKMELGIIYYAAKRYDLAERWLIESERAGCESPLLKFHLAQVYKATQRVNQALEAFNILLRGDHADASKEEREIFEATRKELAGLKPVTLESSHSPQ